MLQKNSTFLLFLISACLLSSCSSVYMPNAPSTPMLTKRGELSASGNISFKGNVSVNAAYAATNHLGILLNGSFMNNKGGKRGFNHNLIETGLGYFGTSGEDNSQIFEAYAGLGRGSSLTTLRTSKDNNSAVKELQDVNFAKYFIQVNFTKKKKDGLKIFGKNIELSYGTAFRLSYLDMTKFMLNNVSHPRESNIFFEPVLFTRTAISKNVQIQYTVSPNIGLRDRKYMTAGNSVFTLGLTINVGGR